MPGPPRPAPTPRPSTAPPTPRVTDVAIAPAAFDHFEQAMEDHPEVALLCRIGRPDPRVAHAACTTERVRAGLRGAWG